MEKFHIAMEIAESDSEDWELDAVLCQICAQLVSAIVLAHLGTTSESAVAERSTACPSLHLRSLMPGTSSGAKGGNDEGPDIIMEKRSFKPGTTADEIITILLDDREHLPPPAKMSKH
ncbi:hypothetical protein MRX96_006272 [Rhipicephalus microplus]